MRVRTRSSTSAVQVCWEKAARYFELEEKLVYCAPDRFVIDPEQAADLVDENTIGICVILGTTYTGMEPEARRSSAFNCPPSRLTRTR